MFKTVNNLVPEYLSDKFASINTIHRHNLRGAQHNLFIPRPNTEALKKSFRYRGAVTWNSLLVEAKQTTTSIVFIPLLYIKIFLLGIYYRIFSIMFVIFKSQFNVHGSLEDHFLVVRIPWLNKVITYLLT